MKVLVACERSGVVRDAFRARGHDAWSCDLVPTESPEKGYHMEGDIRWWLTEDQLKLWQWDLMIAHPECRFLSNSGVLRLYKNGKKVNGPDEERWAKMREAAEFFKLLLTADIPRIAIENPIMHGHALSIIGQNFSQSIQPWQFGEDASKRTCLWLKNIPPLRATTSLERPAWVVCPDGCDDYVCTRHDLHTADCSCPPLEDWIERGDDPYRTYYANQTPSGQNKLGPSPTRSMDRARTYKGIAEAMAEQWGAL